MQLTYLVTLYLLQVDVYGYRRLTSALEWMGVHSLGIFVFVTSNLAVIAIQGFYWKAPENNIVSAHESWYTADAYLDYRHSTHTLTQVAHGIQ